MANKWMKKLGLSISAIMTVSQLSAGVVFAAPEDECFQTDSDVETEYALNDTDDGVISCTSCDEDTESSNTEEESVIATEKENTKGVDDNEDSEEEVSKQSDTEDMDRYGTTSGQCGDNVFWELDDDGVLTISGTGYMWGFNYIITKQPQAASFSFSCIKSPFMENPSIKKIIIMDGVTNIGLSSFEKCSNVEEVIIPDSVTSIEGYAFSRCTELKKITIPDSVTNIAEGVFQDCINITELSFPNVRIISSYYANHDRGACSGCTGLTQITLPKAEFIGGCTFWNCINLKKATISGTIYYNAFQDLANLEEVEFLEGVDKICDSAFLGCSGLKSLTFPEGLTKIEKAAFENCTNVEYVVLPKSIESIGDYAFNNCSSLTDVYYAGSEDDWKNVETNDNTQLTEATIHFNSSGPEEYIDPSESTVEDFVERMYNVCLGRPSDAPGKEGWVNNLKSGNMDGAAIAKNFVFSQEMIDKNLSDEAFVTTLYHCMMGRKPDAPGLKNWLV